MLWDVFISHAHEDKADVARPLARLLQEQGFRVWIDETELTIGDSLRQKIDEGLAQSRFGVVILSESFFAKRWPQSELSALWSREYGAMKVVLPVWHRINREVVVAISPLLADKLAVSTDNGLESVVAAILKVAGGTREVTAQQLTSRYSADFIFPLEIISKARAAIDALSNDQTWTALGPKRDMTSSSVWMGTDSPELISALYDLYVPISAFRQMSYALARSLSTFTRNSQLRYAILESVYYALTNESQLATSGNPVQYTPRVSQWRIKRQEMPGRYWWQGLSEERIEQAKAFFIDQATQGFPQIVDFQTFRQSYLAAYNSSGRNQQNLGLLANALYGFTPQTRPVYWRLLVYWDRAYSVYAGIQKDISVADVVSTFNSQSVSDFALSRVNSAIVYEPVAQTWEAATNFFNRFVVPRIESYVSLPIEGEGD
jgi:hypothetical protein